MFNIPYFAVTSFNTVAKLHPLTVFHNNLFYSVTITHYNIYIYLEISKYIIISILVSYEQR